MFMLFFLVYLWEEDEEKVKKQGARMVEKMLIIAPLSQ
jgi:hypothetical protein